MVLCLPLFPRTGRGEWGKSNEDFPHSHHISSGHRKRFPSFWVVRPVLCQWSHHCHLLCCLRIAWVIEKSGKKTKIKLHIFSTFSNPQWHSCSFLGQEKERIPWSYFCSEVLLNSGFLVVFGSRAKPNGVKKQIANSITSSLGFLPQFACYDYFSDYFNNFLMNSGFLVAFSWSRGLNLLILL